MRTSDSRHSVINIHTNNSGAWLVALMVGKESQRSLTVLHSNHPKAEVIVTTPQQPQSKGRHFRTFSAIQVHSM